jgi:carboxymethylenebutenolidase
VAFSEIICAMANETLQQYLVDEFVEDYQRGRITRRDALSLLGGLLGSAGAASLLAGCGPAEDAAQPTADAPTGSAAAEPTSPAAPSASAPPTASASASANLPGPPKSPLSVAADDPSIVAERLETTGKDGKVMMYVARPKAPKTPKSPIVLVCHENRGLQPHIEDVARRFGKAGYVAVAVDLLSQQGGTPAVTDYNAIPGLLGALSDDRIVGDFSAALAHVKKESFARGDRVGMTGFCFGGGVTWKVALALPEIRAAVPFYGPPVAEADIAKVKASVFAVYAGKDSRINEKASYVEAALKKTGRPYKVETYPDVDHAFHNDTSQRYEEKTATKAWTDTLAWFAKHLA